MVEKRLGIADKVTCVIPTFERPKMLERALRSIALQTWPPNKVVVSENGNLKENAEVVEKFRNDFINLIHLTTTTVTSAHDNWKRGIAASDTEFIKIVWDDDWLEPNCLEVLVRLQEKYSADAILCGGFLVQNGEKIAMYSEKFIVSERLNDFFKPLCSRKLPNSPLASLIRSEDAQAANSANLFPPGSLTESLVVGPDLAINYWAIFGGRRTVFTPDKLVNFFSDGSNMTSVYHKNLPKFYRKTIRALLAHNGYQLNIKRRLYILQWNNSRIYFHLLALLRKIKGRYFHD